MEPKKYKKYDLRPKSGLFFNIGLAISILCVITAFEWRFYDEGSIVDISQDNRIFDELMDIPPTVQPPPVVPLQQPQVIEVPDDEELPEELFIDFDITIAPDAVIEDIIFMAPPDPEPTEEIVDFPEILAEPIGGWEAYYKAIGKALKYPRQAERMNIEGKVFVQFVVDKDGSVTEVQILKGIGAGCDEEAIKAIMEGPKWKPGRQRALPVKSRMRFPINFQLPK
jgi:periplasmic protein TonB